jgi:hypothetical protein
MNGNEVDGSFTQNKTGSSVVHRHGRFHEIFVSLVLAVVQISTVNCWLAVTLRTSWYWHYSPCSLPVPGHQQIGNTLAASIIVIYYSLNSLSWCNFSAGGAKTKLASLPCF